MSIIIISDVLLPTSIGILTAGISWFFANHVFCPHLEISNLKYNSNNRPYLLISNRSKHMNAYEVVCHISYYANKKHAHSRTDITRYVLETTQMEESNYQVKLDGSAKTHALFSKTVGLMLYVVVSYQNKFGVKKSIVKKIIAKDDGNNY